MLADCNKALELDPKFAEAYANRGIFKGNAGDFDGAVADYDKVVELKPREARSYLNRQEELKKKLQGVNDKERAEIRDKLKSLRDQWLEQAREFRKELRERQRELVDKLPDYREVIESARNAAAQQALQSQKDARPHRGED